MVTPVTLLCGFLGSGKTTLLARALEQDAFSNAVVIVNEFGEISIDHLIVADLTENILELRNGCLCCSICGDLTMTLRELHRRRQLGEIMKFNHVVVETTGGADPVPLIHTLMANLPIMQAYSFDTAVCVVDAVNGAKNFAEHATAGNQAALADLIVLSKTDIATVEQLKRTEAAIDQVNPSAQLLRATNGHVAASQVFCRGLFDPGKRHEVIEKWMSVPSAHLHSSIYATHSITHEGTLSLAGTSVFETTQLMKRVSKYFG